MSDQTDAVQTAMPQACTPEDADLFLRRLRGVGWDVTRQCGDVMQRARLANGGRGAQASDMPPGMKFLLGWAFGVMMMGTIILISIHVSPEGWCP